MGKDHYKAADVDDKKKKDADVDTDAEHNKATSRKASNADLKRNAHESAGIKGYQSAQVALKLLSAEFHRWAHRVTELKDSDTSGEAGSEPAAQEIEEIFEQAMSDAAHVGALISAADKNVASTLAPEVKVAQGAAFMFRLKLDPASNWLRTQGHKMLRTDLLTSRVGSYTEKIGLDGTLDQVRTAPEEDEDTLRKELALDEIDALEAAVASVQAGNSDDVNRVRIHASTLQAFAKGHIRISSSKTIKRLQKLYTAVKEMAAKDPSLVNSPGDIKALLLHQ
jgi:hypothetical protein